MELFNYLLKVSACTVLFFGFYLLILRKLTFFKINRFYLLSTLLLSFLIPSLQFTIEREVEQVQIEVGEQGGFSEAKIQSVETTPHFVATESKVEEVASIDWLTLIPYAYICISLVILLLGLKKIVLLLQHTKQKTIAVNGLKLVSKADGFTNCSFFNYVFIDDQSLTKNELDILLQHESVHAKQYHSIDKIVLMLAKAVLWFNPVIYIWDKTLEQVHEYEADEATASSFNNRDYAELLLRLAVSTNSTPLIHNFVKSPITERIKMLFNAKSKNMKKLMYLLVAPIVLGLIFGFSVEVVEVPTSSDLKIEAPNAKTDKLWDKTITGKVKSILITEVGEVLNFSFNGTIIRVFNYAKGKVKVGDKLSIKLNGTINGLSMYDAKGKILKKLDAPCYGASLISTLDGKVLYETKNKNIADKKKQTQSQNSFIKISDLNPIDGNKANLVEIKAPKGKKIMTIMIQNIMSVKFLIAEKLYSLEQAKQFDERFLNKLSEKQGVGRGFEYDIKGVGVNDYVVWFGKEPDPISAVDKSKKANAKYVGKTIVGKITDYTYSPKHSLLMDGFVIRQKNGESLKIYIGKNYGELVNAQIKIDDEVKIQAFSAKFSESYFLAEIDSAKVVKNGVTIFENAKYVADAGLENAKELSKIFAKFGYYAGDSVIMRRDRKIIDLYGNAKLNIDSVRFVAKHINIDFVRNLVTAYEADFTDMKRNVKMSSAVSTYNLDPKKYGTVNSIK